ncbi:MAG: leucine-rich repeat protein, partial [Oscillospiraceae bacterium]|nr:leucine-rich repeat protein [Oscillospiraceae bacterium]
MTGKHTLQFPVRKIMLTFLLAIGVLAFLSLQPVAAQIEKDGDLHFQLNYDGKSYAVTGCEETATGDLVIPATYKGLPVTGIGASAFWECANLTGITVPDGITVINPNTFYGCTGLKSITLPDSVTVIGRGAFSGCTGLTGITLGKNLTLIEGTAFQACSNLKSITIPEGVTEIGERAFEGCTNLTNISIPSSVTVLAGAFLNCPNLAYTVYDNGKYLGNASNPHLVLMESTAKDITQCNIHTDTRFIYFWAFADCTNLTEITVPDKVTHIGTGVFAACVGLTDVTIGKETRNIESSAFSGCTKLKGIWVPEENPNFTSSLGILFTKDKT